MSLDTTGVLVVVLAGATLVATLPAWTRIGLAVWAPASTLLLAATLVLTGAADPRVDGAGATTLLVLLAGAAAVSGGGPLTTRVFGWADRQDQQDRRRDDDAGPDSIEQAGRVLRGGAWIGVLERAAVFATLIAGWPEGLAVVLAIKGVGRYPELRATEDHIATGTAERFIIGTLTSVLWAVACAGVVLLAV